MKRSSSTILLLLLLTVSIVQAQTPKTTPPKTTAPAVAPPKTNPPKTVTPVTVPPQKTAPKASVPKAASVIALDAMIVITESTRFNFVFKNHEIAEALLGGRGGFVVDLLFKPSNAVGIGLETGFLYWQFPFTLDRITTNYFFGDVPVTIKSGVSFGLLGLEAYAGLLATGTYTDKLFTAYNYLCGARAFIGDFFVDSSYVIRLTKSRDNERDTYLRAGLGWRFKLLK